MGASSRWFFGDVVETSCRIPGSEVGSGGRADCLQRFFSFSHTVARVRPRPAFSPREVHRGRARHSARISAQCLKRLPHGRRACGRRHEACRASHIWRSEDTHSSVGRHGQQTPTAARYIRLMPTVLSGARTYRSASGIALDSSGPATPESILKEDLRIFQLARVRGTR
jgi:hypothetical protein